MKKLILITILVLFLFPATVQAEDENPWNEVFDDQGNLRPTIVDLGITTEQPEWMAVDLPFGQSLNLEANYHRYQTTSGNVVVLPSPATLFFMAMNPQESGLDHALNMAGNGYGSVIAFLGLVAGDSLDWEQVKADHPEYQSPDQFWNAVLNGKETAWTYFTGWNFITNLLSISWDDASLRTAYLMYLNGVLDCSTIPGGCTGILTPPPAEPSVCSGPQVTVQQPTLSIRKTDPAFPLVIGQDGENQRGADVLATVAIPPVIFTWYEPIYEEQQYCRAAGMDEIANCQTDVQSPTNDGILTTELVFVECRQHIEYLPERITSLRATARLDAASQNWIKNQLGQTHYGASIHQSTFTLIPDWGTWETSCAAGGTCTATARAIRIPFADPGTFNLKLNVITGGTQFMGIPITQPRTLEDEDKLQVYVTLPALIP